MRMRLTAPAVRDTALQRMMTVRSVRVRGRGHEPGTVSYARRWVLGVWRRSAVAITAMQRFSNYFLLV